MVLLSLYIVIIINIIIIIIETAKAVHMANTPKIIGTAYTVLMGVKGLISSYEYSILKSLYAAILREIE
jgi:hypothetical protein